MRPLLLALALAAAAGCGPGDTAEDKANKCNDALIAEAPIDDDKIESHLIAWIECGHRSGASRSYRCESVNDDGLAAGLDSDLNLSECIEHLDFVLPYLDLD